MTTSDERGSFSGECLLTVRELAFLAGTTHRVIERLVRFEIIEPEEDEPEPCFHPRVLPRIRKALRMRDHLEVSWSSMELVLELLERIDALQTLLHGGQAGGTEDQEPGAR